MLERVDELIGKRESFALETTLSGNGLTRQIAFAQENGFKIHMKYFYTPNPSINLKRIRNRVIEGGHDVPAKDVRRLYGRSLWNLFHVYMDLCDKIDIYDNREGAGPVRIATHIKGLGTAIVAANMETWSEIKRAGNVVG